MILNPWSWFFWTVRSWVKSVPSIKHSSLFPNRLIFPFFILLSDINSSELRFVINALNAFDALKIEKKARQSCILKKAHKMKHFEKTLHFQQFEWFEPMKVMTGPACTLRCHAVCYGMCNEVLCEPSSCNVSQ